MEVQKFEIDGHEYILTPHDGIEGIPIIAELAAIASEPLLNMLKAQIVNGAGGGLNIGDVLASLDLADVGANLRGSLYRLAERPQIIQAVFSRTVRDGQQLSNPAAFRMAYQGRWAEMLKALVEIIQRNGFIPF
jgi:hypothetical protein